MLVYILKISKALKHYLMLLFLILLLFLLLLLLMLILLKELHRMFTEKTVSAIQDAMQYFTFVLKQVGKFHEF